MQHFIAHYGYIAVFIFTVLESACIPLPSEVTLSLGGALCSTAFATSNNYRPLNLVLVIVIGIIGSIAGSYLAYLVGRTGGRSFVDRYGKYVLLSHADLDKSEAWFKRRGPVAVLIGRVIPLVRTFISFPAGMAEMQPGIFGIYTAIGVAIWVSLFSWLGYHFGGQYHKYTKGVSYAGYLVAAAVVALVAFGIWHRYRSLKHGGSPRNRHVKR